MFRIGNRIGCLLLTALLCWQMLLPVQAAENLQLASAAAVLMDAQTGQVLYQKNMHQQLFPASITKVMTGLLAMRNLDLDAVLTVSQEAVNAVPRTSSHISLLPGEELSVEQAMYAIGMESANDAANVLAEAVSGSLEEFGKYMTQEAHALGAVNTNFTNANGLPDSQHYTTAYDMALITAAALQEPGLVEYFGTVEYLFSPTNLSDARTFANKDRLLPGGQYYYEGVLMAKTGWTSSAQGTFVAAVRRGDRTLIVAALKSPMLEDKYRDTTTLLDYGFDHCRYITLTGEEIAETLTLGDYVPVSGQTFSFWVGENAALSFVMDSAAKLSGHEEKTVTVRGTADGLTLPEITLRVHRPGLEHLWEDFQIPEEVEVAVENVKHYGFPAAAAVALAFLMVSAFRKLRHEQLRRRRRHKLQARIRRMKRQMKK